MRSRRLIIRVCRHTFPDGRRCRGAAIRGRVCCRHHLDAKARLHNMARARRVMCIPRLRVPITPRDLDSNRAEVLRVVATGYLDFATARMMLWAMQLFATGVRSEFNSRQRRARILPANSQRIYQVPEHHLFSQSSPQNPPQMSENTRKVGEGVHTLA